MPLPTDKNSNENCWSARPSGRATPLRNNNVGRNISRDLLAITYLVVL